MIKVMLSLYYTATSDFYREVLECEYFDWPAIRKSFVKAMELKGDHAPIRCLHFRKKSRRCAAVMFECGSKGHGHWLVGVAEDVTPPMRKENGTTRKGYARVSC